MSEEQTSATKEGTSDDQSKVQVDAAELEKLRKLATDQERLLKEASDKGFETVDDMLDDFVDAAAINVLTDKPKEPEKPPETTPETPASTGLTEEKMMQQMDQAGRVASMSAQSFMSSQTTAFEVKKLRESVEKLAKAQGSEISAPKYPVRQLTELATNPKTSAAVLSLAQSKFDGNILLAAERILDMENYNPDAPKSDDASKKALEKAGETATLPEGAGPVGEPSGDKEDENDKRLADICPEDQMTSKDLRI